MSNYNISNAQTTYYLLSDGTEQNGQNVRTAPSDTVDPIIAVVTISPPLGVDTPCFITGKSGLYVSVPAAESGQYIQWSDEPYKWQVVRTAQGKYEIYVPGQDLYWFDEVKVGIGLSFVLKSGSEAKENEIFFNIRSL